MINIILGWVITIILFAGWVVNGYSIYLSNLDHVTGLLILRIVGVVLVPVGGVLGCADVYAYFNIGELI